MFGVRDPRASVPLWASIPLSVILHKFARNLEPESMLHPYYAHIMPILCPYFAHIMPHNMPILGFHLPFSANMPILCPYWGPICPYFYSFSQYAHIMPLLCPYYAHIMPICENMPPPLHEICPYWDFTRFSPICQYYDHNMPLLGGGVE